MFYVTYFETLHCVTLPSVNVRAAHVHPIRNQTHSMDLFLCLVLISRVQICGTDDKNIFGIISKEVLSLSILGTRYG